MQTKLGDGDGLPIGALAQRPDRPDSGPRVAGGGPHPSVGLDVQAQVERMTSRDAGLDQPGQEWVLGRIRAGPDAGDQRVDVASRVLALAGQRRTQAGPEWFDTGDATPL